MAYTSPGEAAARGIERGMVLGSRLRRDERDEERQRRQDAERDEDRAYLRSQRERTTERQGVLDQRADTEHDYLQRKRDLEVLDSQLNQIRDQYGALLQQYGSEEKVRDSGAWQPLEAKRRELAAQRAGAADKLYRPIVERNRKEAQSLLTGLQDGTVDLGTVSPGALARAVTMATGFHPSAFLRDANGASKIGAGLTAAQRGFEGQDEASLLEGANVLMEPELQVGVGSDGPQGTQIVSKRIVGFVPEPNGRGFIPAMSVTVEDPWGRQLTKPDYIAPPTRGRGMDGDITHLDIDKAFDRMGRLGTMEQLLNQPQIRQMIEQGLQTDEAAVGDVLAGLRLLAPKATNKAPRVDQIQQGNQVTLRISDADDPTKVRGTEVYERGAPPRARGIGGGGAATQLVQGEDEDGNPIWVRVPKQGPAGVVDIPGAAPRSRPESPTAAKADVESQVRAWASKKGWLPNKEAPGGYEKSEPRKDGKGERTVPLTTAERRELEAERVRIEEGRGASRARSAEPGAKPDADRVKTLRTQAEAAIKGGKDAAAVRARFKELTGQDL